MYAGPEQHWPGSVRNTAFVMPVHPPNRLKAAAIKLAVVALVWTVVVTVFAAQFYWLGVDWPIRIRWRDAFLRAVTEWLPWLVLAPPTLWLAERFRLERDKWLPGLWPHLIACVLVALVYQGLSRCLELAGWFQIRSIHAVAKMVTDENRQPPGLPSDSTSPAFPNAMDSSSFTAIPGEAASAGAVAPTAPQVSGSLVVVREPSPARIPAPGFVSAPGMLIPVKPPGPWQDFLRIAVIRSQYSIPIYWSIVALVWVAGYYRQLGERERHTLELEARLSQANLQALKSQIQPHFLFNTLNAIASLVRRQPEAAENMIVTLSDFLRHNLDASREHEVTLRREIETLHLYLEIQQMRFGERLRVLHEIAPAAYEAIVPALLLQPLVENAVRHGIEPRASGGTITLRAQRDGRTLKLEVADDGVGFKGECATAPREGIGLSNTRARLSALYGDDHQFEISPNRDGGIAVRVEIPWRDQPSTL